MLTRGILIAVVAVGFTLGTAVPAAAQLPNAPVGVDDFEFDSFDASYELGRDGDGRSTLRTVETIVAVFPEYDQNRGFIRDLVREYDGHSTELAVVSVTDGAGAPRPYELDENGDFLSVIMAVPEGSFVHGAQTYVIEYTQRDVALRPDDADVDEFAWDVNGTDTRQPIGRLTATLTVADELVPALDGNSRCYRGFFGAGDECELTVDGGVFTADETELMPYENVTVSVGFASGTFADAPVPFFERVPVLLYAGLGCLAAAIALTIVTVVRGRRGHVTGRAIIAQYEAPPGLEVAVAALLLRAGGKAMTATLLDLAVRRRIRLLHDEPTGLYGAQALSSDGVRALELIAYNGLFVGGDTVWFDARSTRLGDAAGRLRSLARRDVKASGYVGRVHPGVIATVGVLFVLALLLPFAQAVVTGNEAVAIMLAAGGINVLIWVLLFTLGGLAALRPRTEKGALLHDHLMGLREYIRLAEADRIRMLQSASGAEVDEQRIVQVYERLLPYAVLFGFEDEWQGQLARYYRETPPEWVAGAAGVSSLSLMHFTRSVASAPATRRVSSSGRSGSSFSSHSSSSGGGFSGGGGGGGGSRGI